MSNQDIIINVFLKSFAEIRRMAQELSYYITTRPIVVNSSTQSQIQASVGVEYMWPELFLCITILFLMGWNCTTFNSRRYSCGKSADLASWWAGCFILCLVSLMYGLRLYVGVPTASFYSNYLYISQGVTAVKFVVSLACLFVLYVSEIYIREHRRRVIEFPVVMLISSLFLITFISINNFFALFGIMAGISLTACVLIIYDVNDGASRTAAIHYFILSAVSSGFLLGGVFSLYMFAQSAEYGALLWKICDDTTATTNPYVIFGVLFVTVAFLFKLFAFPCHNLAPGVYAGSPFPVMMFLMLPVKLSIFLTFMRVTHIAMLPAGEIWVPLIMFCALASMIWGAVAAYRERTVIRLLGYASVSQVGFFLLGLTTDSDEGLRACFFNIVVYAVTTGGLLLVIARLRTRFGAPFIALSDFRGLSLKQPYLCWHLSVLLFSAAGVPPLVGFSAKYILLAALMEKHLFFAIFVALGISIISSYYYLRFIKTFWFERSVASFTTYNNPTPSSLTVYRKHDTVSFWIEAFLWVSGFLFATIIPIIDSWIDTICRVL